jgi:hypothetical protein
MLAHVVSGQEIVVASAGARMSNGRFTDVNSLTFIEAGLKRLRKEILSQRAL